MKTYVLENNNNEVLGYHKNLSDAKYHLTKYPENSARLIMLKGQYFGEGFHKYQITYTNGIFKKGKLK